MGRRWGLAAGLSVFLLTIATLTTVHVTSQTIHRRLPQNILGLVDFKGDHPKDKFIKGNLSIDGDNLTFTKLGTSKGLSIPLNDIKKTTEIRKCTFDIIHRKYGHDRRWCSIRST